MDKVVYRGTRSYTKSSKTLESKPLESVFNNVFVKILLISVSAFLMYSAYRSALITKDKIDISKRAQKEVDDLRVHNLELALELNTMQSEEFLEIQARDRLNFAGNNEYIFVIPESLLSSAKEQVNTFLYGVESEDKRVPYEIWYEFLSEGI